MGPIKLTDSRIGANWEVKWENKVEIDQRDKSIWAQTKLRIVPKV